MFGFLKYTFGGNFLGQYLGAFLVFLILVAVFSFVRFVAYKRMKIKALQTETVVDDVVVTVIGTINPPFYTYLSLFLSVQTLWKPQWLENAFLVILLVWLSFECLTIVREIIQDVSIRYGDRKRNLKSAVALVSILIFVVIWIIGGAVILANLGIDPTALLAGLGVSGIIVALALQNVVGDLFGYFSLRLDNPVTEGDFVAIGDKQGNVTKIGLKTTRLRALTGEEVIISNKDVLSGSILNYGKAEKRGAIFQLIFSPSNALEDIMEVPHIIRRHIEKRERVEFHRSHLRDITMTGYVVETFYKVREHDFDLFCDVHQAVLHDVLEELQKQGYRLSHSTAVIANS